MILNNSKRNGEPTEKKAPLPIVDRRAAFLGIRCLTAIRYVLFLDVLASFDRVLERIGFGRILLSFDDEPAIVVAVIDDVEDRTEVEVAIARDREHACADACEEAHVLFLDFVADVHADVLEMYVTDARQVLLEDVDRVLTGADEMARIVEQEDEVWIRHLHEAVNLFRRLDTGAHVIWYVIVRPIFLATAPSLLRPSASVFHCSSVLCGLSRKTALSSLP